MNIWAAMILALALSIDAFGIGFSCSLRGIRNPFVCKLIVCGVSVLITAAATFAGSFAMEILPEGAGNVIGSVLLILLGIYIFFGNIFKNSKSSEKENTAVSKTADILLTPESCDMDRSSYVDIKEAFYTGVALSADSFSAGLGAGMSGNAEFIPIFCGIFQFVFLWLGEFCGIFIKKKLPEGKIRLTLLSSVILIVLGIVRLVM